MKSSIKSTDLTANTPYYSSPIRRIQEFDESKDYCLTLKNTPYPHQRYTVYNTLVNEEESTGFTLIRHIHQEDTAYSCLYLTDKHEGLKTYTHYPGASIRRIQDVHDLESIGTEFPAIVFNDTLTSEALSCEPMVSSLNNDEINSRISFDESDDEDCTVIFDKNSFSYKIISVNDLKTDSENDNDKVDMPLPPSPKPKVSYFDDLDYFKDFEKEFPAIVYNMIKT
ncbi:hypothetical protein Tco_0393956 [Tanacetum coccineum]